MMRVAPMLSLLLAGSALLAASSRESMGATRIISFPPGFC